MQRQRGAWRRLGLQVGLLAGIGLALARGVGPAGAMPLCVMEGDCTFKKPLLLFVVDYSTAMNAEFDGASTRWEAAVEQLAALMNSDNGYLQGNVLLGLLRYGHDPDPDQPGTTIPGDASGLVDGQKLDLEFYDADDPNKSYYHCNGEAFVQALANVPPPLDGAEVGIGAWTAGALRRAEAVLGQAALDHPEDVPARKAVVVLVTQGVWTDPTGQMALDPPDAAPELAAAELFQNSVVPTFVLSLGDAGGTAQASAIAVAGGTEAAYTSGPELDLALKQMVQSIINDVFMPPCEPGFPRVMFVLDASSSMLNVRGDSVAGEMGATRWDLLGHWLDGIPGALRKGSPDFYGGSIEVEDIAVVGVTVFGAETPDPGEAEVIIDYGPCRAAPMEFALDPQSSCVAPDCVDPWAGPPITWTFQDKQFGSWATARSHMPRCDADPQKPGACTGSGAALHQGLLRVQANLQAYKASCVEQPEKCDEGTKYYNVLIMDGTHDSDEAEVEALLTAMHDAGTTTFVIGLGELAASMEATEQLSWLATWGSGGGHDFFAADTQVELQAALAEVFAQILAGVELDPCCALHDCGALDESDGPVLEPDPVPGTDSETGGTGTTAGTTDTGGTTETGTSGATSGTTGTSEGTTGSGGAATMPEPTTGAAGTAGTGGASTSGDTSEPSSATDPGQTAEDGCACRASDARGSESLLGWLVLAGLAGRRRRGRGRALAGHA